MDIESQALGEWEKGPKTKTVLSALIVEGYEVLELRDFVRHTDRVSGQISWAPSFAYMLSPDPTVLEAIGEALIAEAGRRRSEA